MNKTSSGTMLNTGWTPPSPKFTPLTKSQLRGMCEWLLERGYKDAAFALDNAIDVISETANKLEQDDLRDLRETERDALGVGLQ